jgi:hypothetical protein
MEEGKPWRKSSFSGEVTCVEVRVAELHVEVRNSRDPNGVRLRFNKAEWIAFLEGVKNSEFDL